MQTNKLGNNMEINYNEEERYYQAKKRVEEIKGFYGNLIAYVVVNIGLMVLNLVTSPNHLWFFWPMLGWGIGVAAHAFQVFGIGKDWEERQIQKYLEKEEKDANKWK